MHCNTCYLNPSSLEYSYFNFNYFKEGIINVTKVFSIAWGTLKNVAEIQQGLSSRAYLLLR